MLPMRRVFILLTAVLLLALLLHHRTLAYDAVGTARIVVTKVVTEASDRYQNGEPEPEAESEPEPEQQRLQRPVLASEYSSFYPPPEPQDDYISACLAIKDQRKDLPEWLHHHYYHMGIGHFFIMDDGSNPPLEDMAANLTIPREKVEFHYFPAAQRIRYMQYELYTECINIVRYRMGLAYNMTQLETERMANASAPASSAAAAVVPRSASTPTTLTTSTTASSASAASATPTSAASLVASYVHPTWMAFFDTDEFLDSPGDQTLRQVLEAYEPIQAIGGLGINWRVHTSDGNLQRQPTVLGSYLTCIVDEPSHNGAVSNNHHIKSIVRVSAYDHAFDPHSFVLRNNSLTVGEFGDVIGADHIAERGYPGSPFRFPITRERFALHHYLTKSRAEYEEKMQRGSAMSNHKGWDSWDKTETGTNHTECHEMLRWARPAAAT